MSWVGMETFADSAFFSIPEDTLLLYERFYLENNTSTRSLLQSTENFLVYFPKWYAYEVELQVQFPQLHLREKCKSKKSDDQISNLIPLLQPNFLLYLKLQL